MVKKLLDIMGLKSALPFHVRERDTERETERQRETDRERDLDFLYIINVIPW